MFDTGWRPPTLETERLLLRPLDESDAAAVFAYASNDAMTRFTLWETHKSIDDSIFFVRDYARSRYLEEVPEPLGIVLKSDVDRLVVGSLGCFWVSQTDCVMELGYNVAEAFWGRGITAEAARAVLAYAFTNYPVYRIQARVIYGNHGSARVAEKLGMKCEGTLRGVLFRRGRHEDVQLYSILRSEWEAGRALHSDKSKSG